MADPVAAEAPVVVGGVVGDRETELLAHRGGLEPAQGQDRVAPAGSDRSEACCSRASEQRQQDGFSLVVGGVAGQGVGAESRPASGAGACFEVRTVDHVDDDRAELDPEVCCGGSGDLGVDIGARAQSVVDMHGGDPAAGFECQDDERCRVGSAGQRAGDRAVRRRKGAAAEEVGGVDQRMAGLGSATATGRCDGLSSGPDPDAAGR